MTPLLDPDTVACPEVKLIAVVEPKLIAVPEELVTVGCVPFGAVFAPEKTRLCDPL